MAIASLVTGILGFMGPVLFSIVAILTGYAARKDTRSLPPRASGDGMATIGIVLGYVQLGLVAFAVCVALVLFILFGLGITIWGASAQ
jgi:hypothetical protein